MRHFCNGRTKYAPVFPVFSVVEPPPKKIIGVCVFSFTIPGFWTICKRPVVIVNFSGGFILFYEIDAISMGCNVLTRCETLLYHDVFLDVVL